MRAFRWAIGAIAGGVVAATVAVTPAYAAPGDVPADPALAAAVQRDLKISWPDYVASSKAAATAARMQQSLAADPGFHGVTVNGTAITVTGSGAAVSRAASAYSAKVVAPTSTRRPAELANEFTATVPAAGVNAVVTTADGLIVRAQDPGRVAAPRAGARATSVDEFARTRPAVKVVRSPGAKAHAARPGDQIGWNGSWCSLGFPGYDRDGRQVTVTAGHCANDGQSVMPEISSLGTNEWLGRVAFSQFGGWGNSAASPQQPGMDLAVYAGSFVDVLPQVNAWNTAGPRVTGELFPVQGAYACTSGARTRQFRCGKILGTGAFDVDGRWIKGFVLNVETAQGDSGGPILSGVKATGVVSGGVTGEAWTIGALLDPLEAQGYRLEVWLNPPLAPAGAPGSTVKGKIDWDLSVRPSTRVEVRQGDWVQQSVSVDKDGNFAFTAPAGAVVLRTVDGRNRSDDIAWLPTRAATQVTCGLRDAGCRELVAGGALYSHGGRSPILVEGTMFGRYQNLGEEKSQLGYPTSPRFCGLRDGGCLQRFEGGILYATPSGVVVPVWGALLDAWGRQGWENGPLGYPKSVELCVPGRGGCYQGFEGAMMTWSPTTGAHPIKGRILQRWDQLGAMHHWLGYPVAAEQCGLRDGGCLQRFEGGIMYWSPSTDAHAIRGAIFERWGAERWETGFLGYPLATEHCGLRDGGCFQVFQGGSIYYSPRTGAQWTRGAIRDAWGRLGWEGARLGYPTEPEICGLRDGGCLQRFQGGIMYWSPATGAHPSWGAIFDHWGRNGWERGRFGYPRAAESCRDIGGVWTCTQAYQGGTISWNARRGAWG